MSTGLLNVLTDLIAEVLSQNLSYCLLRWNPCVEPTSAQLSMPPFATTCTFPQTKRWGDQPHQHCHLYRQILFEDRALLSDQLRDSTGRHAPGEPRRKMSHARAVGLDHFVFAYLGVHDPYYAKEPLNPTPPFGIFITPSPPPFPATHATRRDLDSPQVEWPPDREFLLVDGAQRLLHYEVTNTHAGDFWHYWGSSNYWVTPGYADEHWQWTIEFHYKDTVPVSQFEAILWAMSYPALKVDGDLG